MAMPTDSIGVILLAAGSSARLGKPKQLLKFQGETLLRHQTKIALGASASVTVTLGSRIEIVRKEVEDLPVEIVENEDWESGMSSSIRVGLKKLLDDDRLKAAIVMVCDQPFVTKTLLEKIIAKFQETDSLIVACAYRNTFGVPALFHRRLFPELLALDAQAGAKHLIQKYAARAEAILFPEGAFDVDTPADYEKLIKKNQMTNL